jgi:hypothetical protein
MGAFCNPADKLIHIANNPKGTISADYKFTDMVSRNLEAQEEDGDEMDLPSVIGVNASLATSAMLSSSQSLLKSSTQSVDKSSSELQVVLAASVADE